MNTLQPFEFFKISQALTLHFKKPDFDWFKSNGGIRCSPQKFDSRRDAKLYAYAAAKLKPKEIVQFHLANILNGNLSMVYDFDFAYRTFYNYRKHISALTNNFAKELHILLDILEKDKKNVDSLFELGYNSHPKILNLFIGNKISLETMVLIDKFCRPFVMKYDELLEHDPVWKPVSIKIKKYSPFLDGKEWIVFDPSKVKIIWHDFLKDSELILL